MSSTVYFTDLRAGHRENLFAQLLRLIDQAGIASVVGRGRITSYNVCYTKLLR